MNWQSKRTNDENRKDNSKYGPGIYKNESCIYNPYNVQIRGVGKNIHKYFSTLEEAINFRKKYIQQKEGEIRKELETRIEKDIESARKLNPGIII